MQVEVEEVQVDDGGAPFGEKEQVSEPMDICMILLVIIAMKSLSYRGIICVHILQQQLS